MDWNTGKPVVLGNEFRPAVAETLPTYRVVAPSNAVAQTVESTATETVNQLAIYTAPDTATGTCLVETFEAGNEIPGAVTTTIVRPNDVDTPVTATPSTGAAVLAIIERTTIEGDLGTYVGAGGSTPETKTGMLPHMRFATTGLFAGERILDVRLVMVVSDPNNEGIGVAVEEFGVPGGPAYRPWQFITPAAFGPTIQTVVVSTGEINPATFLPWTEDDLDVLDDPTDAFNLRVWVHQSNLNLDGPSAIRLYQVWLEVDHCVENRLSRDIVTPGALGARWTRFTPTRPDGTTPNIAKASGTDLTTVLRQARYGTAIKPTPNSGDYTFSVPYILGSNDTPPAGLAHYARPTLAPNGSIVELGDPAGNRTIGVDLRVAGAGSVDAQTYIRVAPVTAVDGGDPIQQEIRTTIAETYAGVIIPVRVVEDDPLDQLDLTVELRRRSDNALMGTVTCDHDLALTFAAGVGGWRVLQLPFDSPANLAATTQYYLNVIQDSDGGSYTLASFDANSGGAEAQPDGNGGYDGTTDVATYDGGDHSTADLAALVYISYDTPEDFAASGDSIPIDTLTDCGPIGIGFMRLNWTPFDSGGGLAYYEVQRLDDHSIWATIGRVADYTRGSWFDFECRLGIESCYRLRAVSTVGLVSDWSETVCGTAPVDGCGYTFTSGVLNNGGTGLMVAYVDTAPSGFVDRPVQFPEADEVKRQAIFGRPMFVSFVPADRRGDEFSRRLYLSGLVTPDTPPPGAADDIRDLSRYPGLPYVCVRDEHGGRWFANVRISDYNQKNPGEFQHVTALIGERLATPYAAIGI